MTEPDRFWIKVDEDPHTGCWLWTASRASNRYGQFMIEGRPRKAHRVAYEREVGPIPDGLELDHLCRVRRCVNPAHLEPVTHRENFRRGLRAGQLGAMHAAKTHCPQGHPYSGDNLYTAARGDRMCRTCRTAAAVRSRQRATERAIS